jgi:hypothetical protein
MLGNYQFTFKVELTTGTIAILIGIWGIQSLKNFTDVTIGEKAILAVLLGFMVLWGLNRIAPAIDEAADWAFDKINQYAIRNMKKNKIAPYDK